MSPYQQPLDPEKSEIRLLSLLPDDNFKAAIHCSLQVASLDETTDFEALSYVWGDPDKRELIYVGGEPMLVTVNLVAALRRLRRPCSSSESGSNAARVLWVDAICINQNHMAERNAQIPLMARLYRSAKSVLAWLGEPTQAMEAAILWACDNDDVEFRVGPASSAAEPTPSIEPSLSSHLSKLAVSVDDAEVGYVEELLCITKLSQALEGYAQFKKHTYWTRMWTFQEWRLPRIEPVCICGQYSFSVYQLLDRTDVPLLGAFLNHVKRSPDGWTRPSSLLLDSNRLRNRLREAQRIEDLYTKTATLDHQIQTEQHQIQILQHQIRMGKGQVTDFPVAPPVPSPRFGENHQYSEKILLFLEIDDVLGSRKNSEEYMSDKSSEFRALVANPELFLAPESDTFIQCDELAMNQVTEHAVKIAAVISLDSAHSVESAHPLTMSCDITDHRAVIYEDLEPLQKTKYPFLDLLLDSRPRQCHDKQDKVYALYGMAPEKLQRLYPPDYDKTPGQIFHETAAYVVEYEHHGVDKLFKEYGFRDWKTPQHAIVIPVMGA
ncbi:HET-domain-containing protein [Apiospora sp. TS-2023a]